MTAFHFCSSVRSCFQMGMAESHGLPEGGSPGPPSVTRQKA